MFRLPQRKACAEHRASKISDPPGPINLKNFWVTVEGSFKFTRGRFSRDPPTPRRKEGDSLRRRDLKNFQNNSQEIDREEGWEVPVRLTPEEIAERDAAAQILVEKERHRLRMEEVDAEKRAEEKAEEERIAEEKRAKAAKKRRLTQEEKRLRESYKELPEDLMRVAEGLIQRAAFMRITLEEYERDLEEKGYVEMFSQSPTTPPYERERPVARLYGTMNSNYQKIIKQLADLVPPAPPPKPEEKKKDEFEELLER